MHSLDRTLTALMLAALLVQGCGRTLPTTPSATSKIADPSAHAALSRIGDTDPVVKIIDLGAGDNSAALDINNRGQVIGNGPTIGGFLWENGKLTNLGAISAFGINDRGQVVGYSGGHVVLWERGVITDLGIPFAGRKGSHLAINNRGQVVVSGGPGSAFLWENGKVTPLPSGINGNRAINDRGQIVLGTSIWEDGKMIDLGLPGGGWAINNRDQIVGRYSGGSFSFLWQNGKFTDIGPFRIFGGGFYLSINDRGQIVGNQIFGDNAGNHAFLWENGKTTDLGPLGGSLNIPTSINNQGQVVGYCSASAEPTAPTRACLWQTARRHDEQDGNEVGEVAARRGHVAVDE